MAAGIVFITLGVVFMILGILLWKKKMISLMHSYHTDNISEENVVPFARLSGIGVIIIGAGMLGAGIWILIKGQMLGFLCFAAGFIIGFGLLLYSVVKYNR